MKLLNFVIVDRFLCCHIILKLVWIEILKFYTYHAHHLLIKTISRTRLNDVHCVFLDTHETFDKVYYAKLFFLSVLNENYQKNRAYVGTSLILMDFSVSDGGRLRGNSQSHIFFYINV